MLTATRRTAIVEPYTEVYTSLHQGGILLKSEHQIQNEIMLAVSQHGCTIARSNAGRAYSKTGAVIQLFPKGWPDLTGFRHSDGKVILIEVKNEKGRLRDDQKRFAEVFKDVPIIYGVARSAEDAVNIIEGK